MSDSMFANEIVTRYKTTVEQVPVCPVCDDDIEPGSSEACSTPTGLWIIHKDCIVAFNKSRS